MSTTNVSPPLPTPFARILTAVQWTLTAVILYLALGSGLVLLVSELTHRSVVTILLGMPTSFPYTTLLAAGLGLIGGAYWPVIKGDSEARELELDRARYLSIKLLSIGLILLLPVSLIDVFTVTRLVTNLFVFGLFLLVCVYTYAYNGVIARRPTS